MLASVYYTYGPPEVLQVKTIEKPTPKSDEVLIKVFATTVNRTDCALLTAKPWIMRFIAGLLKPKKPILGTDFAGIVEAIGTSVTKFKVGDRVFGFNDQGVSSHAQFMVLSESEPISLIPNNLSYDKAAASIEGFHYAYNIVNKVQLGADQHILVNGATGAIGSALVQILKYNKINITAVCDTRNLELIRSIGADIVVDYLKKDFTNSNQKYDMIFDAVGKSSFGKCKRILKDGGIFVSSELGKNAQNLLFALTTPLVSKINKSQKKVIFPVPSNIQSSLDLVKKMIEENKFNPLIDQKFPLEKIADAFRYVIEGYKIGNVIINPN